MDKHLVLTMSNEGRLHIDYVWGLYGVEGILLPSRLYRGESGGKLIRERIVAPLDLRAAR